MQTAKDEFIKVLEALPDDSTYEELLKELSFAAMVRRGLRDSDEGRVISHEELVAKIQKWHA